MEARSNYKDDDHEEHAETSTRHFLIYLAVAGTVFFIFFGVFIYWYFRLLAEIRAEAEDPDALRAFTPRENSHEVGAPNEEHSGQVEAPPPPLDQLEPIDELPASSATVVILSQMEAQRSPDSYNLNPSLPTYPSEDSADWSSRDGLP